jgi:nucleoside recognition membrane protein YjiH
MIINSLPSRKLFLIDGFGAVLSAILLGLVLTSFKPWFGMPVKVLYILASLAVLFALYSFSCFLLNPRNWKPFLKVIAFINLGYYCLTLGLVYLYFADLTSLGLAYFLIEVLIVFVLAAVELNTAFGQ